MLQPSHSVRGARFSSPRRFLAIRVQVAQPSITIAPSYPTEARSDELEVPAQIIELPRPLTIDLGMLQREQDTEGRPLVPSLSLSDLQATVFGSSSSSKMLPRLLNALGNKLSIYRPSVPRPADSTVDPTELPLIFYLPGIDGTGLAAYQQFPELVERFDLRNLFIPPEDRSSFTSLVDQVSELIEKELLAEAKLTSSSSVSSRPVYLLGESFGGLLAFAIGQKSPFVDRIVLVNPATSFSSSAWPMLGPALTSLPLEIYNLLPLALSPILTNPIAVALNGVQVPSSPFGFPFPPSSFPPPFPLSFPPNLSALTGKGSPLRIMSDVAYGMIDLMPTLSALREVLPPETLAFRLQLLKEGSSYVNQILPQVQQRCLLLTGAADLVIPSSSEGPRLQKALPRCRLKSLPGRSHAMLQEAGVSLVQLMDEEGFYFKERKLTSAPVLVKSADDGKEEGLTGGGATFGRPLPVELPTSLELKAALDAGGLSTLRSIVSPVFFSTDPVSGEIEKGLHHLPFNEGRPILFIGNHQLFAPDMPLMLAEILEKRGTLLRGLAHPFALDGFGDELTSTNSGRETSFGPSAFGSFLKTFGAVRVSGKNLFKLLQQGEAVLLFPGGAREAYKMKGEKYTLLWPKKPEFVRAAAKFGATIIPFAAIGAEDGIEILMDSRELKEVQEGVEGAGADVNPLLRALVRASSQLQKATSSPTNGKDEKKTRDIPQARTGVKALSEEEQDLVESFQPPLISLKEPHRFYFVFRRPIPTRPDMTREETSAIYYETKQEVQAGIEYLRMKSKADPYSNVIERMLYEASWGQRRQAPTFDP